MPRVGSLVLGRFEILDVLGEGGFGVVYLANDKDAGGKVALKVLDPEKSNQEDFVERFRQEVKIIRSLGHHNTVKVFDVDQTEKGCHFMVMEHVEGEDLSSLVARERKLKLSRVVRIGRQILSSLAEAHSRGIIHRDLKPQNIKVQQLRGDPDHVKVLDFGIAKVFSEAATVKTRTGLLLCTPAYAPPELLRAKEVSPATDIYSLGLILFEMATGMPAILGDSEADLIAQQISRDPISIPEELADQPFGRILERALQKDAALRYQSAEEMLEDLDALGEPAVPVTARMLNYEMPRVGEVVNERYQVIRELGAGGFAKVFLVEDRKGSGRLAMKVIDPKQSAEERVEDRFNQEVAVIRQLTHYNTVKIWDVGVTGTGCLYYAMEYVDGEPLDMLIQREAPLPVDRVVHIATQMLKSLSEAHEKGIVHRDLKPANVFVCQMKNETDFVKVIDFGIARVFAPKLRMVKTQTGMILCTPSYAAPELLRQKGVLPATDLYALGLMMLEMLTGSSPVSGNTPYEICARQIEPQPHPIPPMVASMPIGAIIEKAIAKDLEKRYREADEMLADLMKLGVVSAATSRTDFSDAPTDLVSSGAVKPAGAGALPAAPGMTLPLDTSATQGGFIARHRGRLIYAVSAVSVITIVLAIVLLGVLERDGQDDAASDVTPEELQQEPLDQPDLQASPLQVTATPTTPSTTPVEQAVVPIPAPPDGFVLIRAGAFTMGSPASEMGRDDDETQHKVTITRDFFMQATEVTQSQWRSLMGNNPSDFSSCGDSCPVERVDWWQALAYCNALSRHEGLTECYTMSDCTEGLLNETECPSVTFSGLSCDGYRLPTEAEWEYAARAGTSTALYTGVDISGRTNESVLDPIAWYGGNSSVAHQGAFDCTATYDRRASADTCSTHPVGLKEPNSWGLYDMLGNVWEWTWDRYGEYPRSAVTDPLGPGMGLFRVARGGSWDSAAHFARAASRENGEPFQSLRLGFRPARTMSPVEAPLPVEAPSSGRTPREIPGQESAQPVPTIQILPSTTDSLGIRGSLDYPPTGNPAMNGSRDQATGFLLIPAGTFVMGSPPDEPGRQYTEVQHPVTLTRDFLLQATEVTQGQWQALMGNNPSAERHRFGQNYPVEQVNWWEALAYCNALSHYEGLQVCYVLDGCQGRPGEGMTCASVEFAGLDCSGYRLPTEAEWEYAARAGTTTAAYCGADESCLADIAWYNDGERNRPHPVGQKAPNPWGLHDMLGNVWEWTWDWYTDYPEGPVNDPLGPDSGFVRVDRGGGMASGPDETRAAQRDTSDPNRRSHNLGFRVARTAPP